MQEAKQFLIELWKKEIKNRFKDGLLTYERQLQAEIYYQFKSKSAGKYEVWIEPVIYDLDKIKPDIFITKGSKIVAIIEIKFTPWEYPKFKGDIQKFIKFDELAKQGKEFIFGYIPFSDDWNVQKQKEKLEFTLDINHLNVLIVFGKTDSDAFKIESLVKPNNFLLLYGHIHTESGHVFNFKE